MRKLYKTKMSLLLLAFFCTSMLTNVFGQQSIIPAGVLNNNQWNLKPLDHSNPSARSMFISCDTLDHSQPNDTLSAFKLTGAWGYYPGTNSYNLSYAEKFANTVTGTLSSFRIVIYQSIQASASGVVTFNVYGAGATPTGTVLGTKTVAYSNLIPQSYNEITFATPINITGDFYISMELAASSTPQDTAVMGCHFNRSDASRPNTSYIKYNGAWGAASAIFASLKNTSYSIYPILCQNVTSAPVANFGGCNTNVGISEIITFNDLSTNAPDSWSWAITPATGWSFQNGTSAVSQNPDVKFTTAGSYSVALTATNSIGNNTKTSASCITLTGLNAIENSNAVTMLPNPTTGNVSLVFNNLPKNNVQVSIYNTLGALVYKTAAIKTSGDKFDLNLSEFNDGIYFVEVKTDDKVITKRLVVSK